MGDQSYFRENHLRANHSGRYVPFGVRYPRRAVEIDHSYFGTPSIVTLSRCIDLSTVITISAVADMGAAKMSAVESAAHRINVICRCAVAIAELAQLNAPSGKPRRR